MPLQAPAYGMLSKGLYGLARLVAETPAFQDESGLNLTGLSSEEKIASVMQACCYWPEQPEATHLTVPLCLVTIDDDHHLVKSRHKLTAGVALVQLCLAELPGISDSRDRFTDVADRFGHIMGELMGLSETREANRLWVTGWELDRPPILNDPDRYQFATPGATPDDQVIPVRVRIFPVAMRFQG